MRVRLMVGHQALALVMAVRLLHPQPMLEVFFQKIVMQHNRLITFVLVLLMFVVWCAPLSANADNWNDPIDYRDLDYKVTYGTEYNKVVVPLPVSHYYMAAYDMPPLGDGGMIGESFGTNSFTYNYVKGRNYKIYAYPGGWRGFSLDGMPAGTRLHFDLLLTVHAEKDLVVAGMLDLYERSYYLVNGEWKDIKNELVIDSYGWGMPISLDFTVDGYDGASSYVCGARIDHFSAYDRAEVTIVMSNVRLEMDVSVDYWTQWQNEQNGKLLGDIKDSIENSTDEIKGAIGDSTDKVTGSIQDSTDDIMNSVSGVGDQISQDIAGATDQIMTGGQAGGELENDTGKLDQSADDLTNGVGEIDKFEDDLFADVENNLDEIISGANINGIAVPLLFVQSNVEKIFGAIPSNYRVVFTLPIFFGIFLYIIGHPVRAPRPDTSGDIVTRETFTTTEVLTGRNAGRSTTTRTVTQSRITNRSSPE